MDTRRALDCPCGEHLEADDDAALFEAAKRHADDKHGGDPQYSELELLAAIERDGADVPSPDSDSK